MTGNKPDFWDELDSLYASGRFEETAVRTRDILDEYGPDASLLNILARCETYLGRYGQALRLLEQASELSPDWPRLWFNRSIVYLKMGNEKLAEEVCKRALEMGGDEDDAWYYLGVVYERTGRPAEAEKCYRESLEYDREQPETLLNLAVVLFDQDEEAHAEECKALLNELLRLEPDHTDALYSLGIILKKNGDFEGGMAAFARIAELDPTDREAAWQLAKLEEMELERRVLEAEAAAKNKRQPHIEQALNPLAGLPLHKVGRAAGMIWVIFGAAGEQAPRGEWALHIQCPWRWSAEDRILLGYGDLFEPSSARSEQDGPFDWDVRGANRFDERAVFFNEDRAGKIVCTSAQNDRLGGARLLFDDGSVLEIFPSDSLEDEFWRIFRPGDPESHTVVTGDGIE
ncbi:tetratricopeptide repeat protein [Saccharibacillus sp. CPCC 101409]|uniref:tetratricopeptide repeat protein n=1 Tax=Saccharibacillus sp. CPCC 101409 TaxID=3058041 RepID=UPI002672CE09|nr:tetratricopeptide repeat protein [Saccharibacillus sp. CPCC 101409]MDO3410140.1 tetratricopeptide repeat protein [Saccharibacillus sp. CPCC 101409]